MPNNHTDLSLLWILQMFFVVLCIYSLFPFNTTHCAFNNVPQSASYLQHASRKDDQQKKRYKTNHVPTQLTANPLLPRQQLPMLPPLPKGELSFNFCVKAILEGNIDLLEKNLQNLNVHEKYTISPIIHPAIVHIRSSRPASILEIAILHYIMYPNQPHYQSLCIVMNMVSPQFIDEPNNRTHLHDLCLAYNQNDRAYFDVMIAKITQLLIFNYQHNRLNGTPQ